MTSPSSQETGEPLGSTLQGLFGYVGSTLALVAWLLVTAVSAAVTSIAAAVLPAFLPALFPPTRAALLAAGAHRARASARQLWAGLFTAALTPPGVSTATIFTHPSAANSAPPSVQLSISSSAPPSTPPSAPPSTPLGHGVVAKTLPDEAASQGAAGNDAAAALGALVAEALEVTPLGGSQVSASDAVAWARRPAVLRRYVRAARGDVAGALPFMLRTAVWRARHGIGLLAADERVVALEHGQRRLFKYYAGRCSSGSCSGAPLLIERIGSWALPDLSRAVAEQRELALEPLLEPLPELILGHVVVSELLAATAEAAGGDVYTIAVFDLRGLGFGVLTATPLHALLKVVTCIDTDHYPGKRPRLPITKH